MEVDTEAAVSIILQTSWQKLVPIKPASLRLRTYTREPMKKEGEMITQEKYGSQSKELGLIVVQGDGPSLFGCNWLDYFQLDWKTIGLEMLDGGQAKVDVLLKSTRKYSHRVLKL